MGDFDFFFFFTTSCQGKLVNVATVVSSVWTTRITLYIENAWLLMHAKQLPICTTLLTSKMWCIWCKKISLLRFPIAHWRNSSAELVLNAEPHVLNWFSGDSPPEVFPDPLTGPSSAALTIELTVQCSSSTPPFKITDCFTLDNFQRNIRWDEAHKIKMTLEVQTLPVLSQNTFWMWAVSGTKHFQTEAMHY